MPITRNRTHGAYGLQPEALEISDTDRATLRKLARQWPDGRSRLTVLPWGDGVAVTDSYSVRFFPEHTPTAVALGRIMLSEPARMAATFLDQSAVLPGHPVQVRLRLKCSGADPVVLLDASHARTVADGLRSIAESFDRWECARLVATDATNTDAHGDPVHTYATTRPNDVGADLVAINPHRLAPFGGLDGGPKLFAVGSHRAVAVHDERGVRHGFVMPTRSPDAPHWEAPARN